MFFGALVDLHYSEFSEALDSYLPSYFPQAFTDMPQITASQDHSPIYREKQQLGQPQQVGSANKVSPSVGHSETRPFACPSNGCTRSYKRKYELQRHQKKHSGLRPHSCRFMACGRAGQNGFARKDHLKQHLRQVHQVSS